MRQLQAEDLLTSSQLLLAKNEYVQASDAVASAEVLLGDLQHADAAAAAADRRAPGGPAVDKENRRSASTRTGRLNSKCSTLRSTRWLAKM